MSMSRISPPLDTTDGELGTNSKEPFSEKTYNGPAMKLSPGRIFIGARRTMSPPPEPRSRSSTCGVRTVRPSSGKICGWSLRIATACWAAIGRPMMFGNSHSPGAVSGTKLV